MVRDHDKDVKEFEREAQRAKDADVKAWAGKTLPTLREHQQAARQLAANTKAAGSPSAATTPK
jgi:putative membrane protein